MSDNWGEGDDRTVQSWLGFNFIALKLKFWVNFNRFPLDLIKGCSLIFYLRTRSSSLNKIWGCVQQEKINQGNCRVLNIHLPPQDESYGSLKWAGQRMHNTLSGPVTTQSRVYPIKWSNYQHTCAPFLNKYQPISLLPFSPENSPTDDAIYFRCYVFQTNIIFLFPQLSWSPLKTTATAFGSLSISPSLRTRNAHPDSQQPPVIVSNLMPPLLLPLPQVEYRLIIYLPQIPRDSFSLPLLAYPRIDTVTIRSPSFHGCPE